MEKKEIEVICQECGKSFKTTDEDAVMCPDCWEKAVDLNSEGKGN